MKRKRRSDNISSWVVLTLTIFAIITSFITPIDFWIMLLLTGSLAGLTVLTIIGKQDEETLEFFIYEYQLWNTEECKYIPAYFLGEKRLRSKFLLSFHIEDFEEMEDPEELVEAMLNNSWSNFKGYKTKEEAMDEIIERILYLVKLDKEETELLYKEIKSVEQFKVVDLIEKVKKGELKKSK